MARRSASACPGVNPASAWHTVRVHGAAHDRAGAHDCDLDREILEAARPGATEHLDLRAALDLEQPHGIAAADAVVDRGIVEIDAREIRRPPLPRGHELHALLHQRQHSERQEVNLDEAGVVAGILVPLTHDPVLHGGALERDELDERPARDHHPADVLRDVTRQPRDFFSELAQLLPERSILASLESGQLVELIRQSA